MTITAARLNDGIDATTTASGLVAASGFSVNDFRGYKSGKVIVLDMFMARTGTDITQTSGNITDTQICTVPAGWRPTNGTINGPWDNGISEGGFVIGTDGICTLRTASSNIGGTAGTGTTTLRLHAAFIID
ncbi:hypothetical protein C4B68_26075 [Streptomyces dengpaensis]|uniref:Uncharacterized protein n=2 Tax=Streptomyces TaxID=1883 RepID=A0ABM6SV54_9ACTN|nr:hypothetical protein C4B68_26075 [Streptomyces dengpaensis]PIB11282.1 hypothetical protein B1C81_05565 [Streptomyces sp. HG99]